MRFVVLTGYFIILTFGFISLFNMIVINKKFNIDFLRSYTNLITAYLFVVFFTVTHYYFDYFSNMDIVQRVSFILFRIAIAFTFFYFINFVSDFFFIDNRISKLIKYSVFFLLFVSSFLITLSKFSLFGITRDCLYLIIDCTNFVYVAAVAYNMVISAACYDKESVRNDNLRAKYRFIVIVNVYLTMPFVIAGWIFLYLPRPFSDFAPAQMMFLIWAGAGMSIFYNLLNTENRKKTTKDKLTDKEKELIDMICDGLTSKEIAYRIGVTDGTIRNWISTIYKKTDCNNRIELLDNFKKSGYNKAD